MLLMDINGEIHEESYGHVPVTRKNSCPDGLSLLKIMMDPPGFSRCFLGQKNCSGNYFDSVRTGKWSFNGDFMGFNVTNNSDFMDYESYIASGSDCDRFQCNPHGCRMLGSNLSHLVSQALDSLDRPTTK